MIALSDSGPIAGARRLALGINLAGLGLLMWGVTTEARPGLGGRHLAAVLLLAACAAGWLMWVATRVRPLPTLTAVSLAIMGLAGGALATFAPIALTFVGVSALGATIGWTLEVAVWLAATGPLAMLISVPAAGHNFSAVSSGLAAGLAGAAMGTSRRQSQERATQTALVQVSEARAEAEQARAELLSGRNHLARELHDVLAHTLSALSLQLEALDALVGGAGGATPEVRDQLDRSKRLVREGLAEAKGAVRALREDPPPLEDQLTRLAGERQVEIEVSGPTRPLGPDVSLALYRVAQEALTNVVKHAPGSEAAIKLGFDDDRVTLSVANGPGCSTNGSALGETGAGYGLQGIRERVLLIGGRVEAGPSEGGWMVQAEVPT